MDGPVISPLLQYSGPTTTANSVKEGRLMVDTKGMRRKILKKAIKKHKKVGKKS